MFIDKLGNVGIGTTTPGTRLQVYTTGGTQISAIAPATGTAGISIAGNGNALGAASFDIQQDAGYVYLWNRSNTPMLFGVNGAEKVRIDTSGNVGIGTTAPVSKLDLGTNYSDPGTYPNKITLWSSGANNYFGFGISEGDLDYFSQVNHRFYTGYNGSAGSEKMVLTNAGRLGIGTTTPSNKLHVVDSGSSNVGVFQLGAAGRLTAIGADSNAGRIQSYTAGFGASSPLVLNPDGGNVGIGTTTPTTGKFVVSAAHNGNALTLENNSVGKYWSIYNYTNGSATDLRFYEQNTGINALTLRAGGSVGIGTTAPGAKLVVASTNTYDGITVSGNIVPRIVFNSSNASSVYWGVGTHDNDANNFAIGSNASGHEGMTDYLVIDSDNGNVGIGTTNPAGALDIGGGALYFASNATDSCGMYADYIEGTRQLKFGTSGCGTTESWLFTSAGGGDLMKIQANGSVGIGTTAPGAKLDVAMANSARSYSSSVLDFSGIHLRGTYNNTNYSALTFESGGGGGAAVAFNRDSAAGTAISFWTNSVGGNFAASERMRVDSTGSVGIGTATPTQKLQINQGVSGTGQGVPATSGTTQNGILRLTPGGGYGETLDFGMNVTSSYGWIQSTNFGNLAVNYNLALNPNGGNVGIGTTGPYGRLSIKQSTSDFLGGIYLQEPSTADTWGIVGASGTLYFGSATNASAADNQADFSARMVIQQTGSVGIGTTTPWRTLSVTGTVGFDGLTGSTGAGSLCLTANKQVVYNSASDSCLPSLRETKHDITPLAQSASAILEQLQPVSFIYNEGDGRTRYGFIAEDVAVVNPHLATYNASSTISGIDDRAVLALLVKGFREVRDSLLEINDTLYNILARLDTHDAEIAELRLRIEELENGLGNSNEPESPPETPSDTTPPTITISGNNPANVLVGDTYADLGAVAVDDSGVAILRTYYNNVEVTAVSIDTAVAGEHEVVYVATDLAGNSATSTRVVIVE